jgi:hypothetical protein
VIIEALDQRVEVRLTRQAILTKERPLQVRVVLDEAALRRVVGGAEVMRKQFDRLLGLGELPNVIMRGRPLAACCLCRFLRRVRRRLGEQAGR